MTHPYQRWIRQLLAHQARGAALAPGPWTAPRRPRIQPDAPAVMIFSPHPDDECIIGGLALRLLREHRRRVLNVAVTLGSDRNRQQARREEVTAACSFLGFDLLSTGPRGLEQVNLTTRENHPEIWAASVQTVVDLLARHRPALLLLPHATDWNRSHIGTHHLVIDALRRLDGYTPVVIETEFWGPMPHPNLMVEISPRDLADLVAALSLHTGEVQRNPYHLRLPAWMQDNVRRGGEVVGGQGGRAPAMSFATLYRASRWADGRLTPLFDEGVLLPADAPLDILLAP